ncbi:MAG: LacI family DNA-binding transcriptional regulator [Victivallales bacterium]|nr:LacI family DNA-binding transcriptional regulator [Victivallales bacterium]
MKVTLKDIALHLNMNESTVSYALNGKGSIKPETRELVQNTAMEMGYVPNQSARQISTGKSNEVAIVVPNVLSIYGEFCENAFHLISDLGMRSSISISEFSVEREEDIIKDLIGKRVAGILIVSSLELDLEERYSQIKLLLMKHDIPVIYRSETVEYSSVGMDFVSVGMMMGRRLSAVGKKNVCIASPHPPPFYQNITKTMEGLKAGLGENSTIRIEYLDDTERDQRTSSYEHIMRQILSPDWYNRHRKLFHKIMDSGVRTDAIVSPTDTCIMAIKHEAESCGFNIPRDIALISGTRSIASYLSHDDITSVYVPETRMAEIMVKQLIKSMKRPKEKLKSILVKPDFFAGSTI